MIANISWNITNASTGSASEPGHATSGEVLVAAVTKPASLPTVSPSPARSKLPTKPPKASLENDIEKPYRAHNTPTTASAMKFIISMFKTLFARTMPP